MLNHHRRHTRGIALLARAALCVSLFSVPLLGFARPVLAADAPAAPAADTTAKPTKDVLKELLNVPGGLSPTWKFDSLVVEKDALTVQFLFKLNGEPLLMKVIPEKDAKSSAPRAGPFAIEVPPEAGPRPAELATLVVQRLALVAPQWTWPSPATLVPVPNAPAPASPTSAAEALPPTVKSADGSGWVIPAGKEKEILEFLKPMTLGGKLASQYELDGVSVNKDHIRLQFIDTTTQVVTIATLFHESVKFEGAIATGAVKLLVKPGTPEPLVKVLQESLANTKNAKSPWTYLENSPLASGAGSFGTLPMKLEQFTRSGVALTWVLVVLLMVSSAMMIRRQWKLTAPPRPWLLAVAGLTLLSFIVRWKFSLSTYLHELYHVADHTEMMLAGGGGLPFYGATGPSLYRFVNGVFGGTEQAIFRTNFVLASLTIPAVVALDLAVFREWPRAILAGLIFALLPVHIRFSACEDLTVPGLFFATCSTAAFVHFWNTKDRWSLVAATAALMLAVNCRPELVIFPAVLAFYVLFTRPVGELRELIRPAFLVALAVATINLVIRVMAMPKQTHFESAKDIFKQLPSIRELHLVAFFDHHVVPFPLVLMAIAGIVAAFMYGEAQQRRVTLWLVGTAAVYVIALLTLFKNPPPSNLRTQLVTLPFLILVCAGSLRLLIAQVPRFAKQPALAWAAIGVTLIFGFATRVKAIRETGDLQQEWAFLHDNVSKLPKGPGVLLSLASGSLDSVGMVGKSKIALFPKFLLEKEAKELKVLDLDRVMSTDDWPEVSDKVFYYEGMYCYFYFIHREDEVKDLHRRCQAVHDRYELKPIATQTIAGPGSSPVAYRAPPYSLGLYEVVGLKQKAADPSADVPKQ